MDHRRWVAIILALLNMPVSALGETTLEPVARSGLCVTNGEIASPVDGAMRVESASSRAIVPASDGQAAEIRFRYLGPSAQTKPLASGEMRQQIGLKLRSLDQCNLLYVMWHIDPDPKIEVLIKRNPGQSTHVQCRANGYLALRPEQATVRPPATARGSRHVLRAELTGSTLTVLVDGAPAWRGVLPADADGLAGPAGLRTDNASFDVQLFVAPGSAGVAQGCSTGEGD